MPGPHRLGTIGVFLSSGDGVGWITTCGRPAVKPAMKPAVKPAMKLAVKLVPRLFVLGALIAAPLSTACSHADDSNAAFAP